MTRPGAQPEKRAPWLPDQQGPDSLDGLKLGFRLSHLDDVLDEASRIARPSELTVIESSIASFGGFTLEMASDDKDSKSHLSIHRGDVEGGQIYTVTEAASKTVREIGGRYTLGARFSHILFAKNGDESELDHTKSMYLAAFTPSMESVPIEFLTGDEQAELHSTAADVAAITDSRLDDIQVLIDVARGALRSKLT